MRPRERKIQLEAGSIGKPVVEGITNIDLTCESWMTKEEQILRSLHTAEIGSRAEVRNAPAEECVSGQRIIGAAGTKVKGINGAAPDTPRGIGMEVNQLRRQLKDLAERMDGLRGFL